jgi:membrane fusion protein, heavy metal efflux system
MAKHFALEWQRRIVAALFVLLTAAATWILAHEGHTPLPARGVDTHHLALGKLIVSREALEALGVQTAEVVSRPVEEYLLASATLTPPWNQHAFASSRLPGRIIKLNVQPGQRVAKGDVLAEVESLELESLQQEILTVRNDLRLAKQIVEDLAKATSAIPEQTLLEAQLRQRQNENAQLVAQTRWRSLGLLPEQLEDLQKSGQPILKTLPVRSPIRGTIIHADLGVGKVVEPLEHLFEVVDLSTVWVHLGVLEQDLLQVSVGQAVEVRLPAYPGEVFRTTVQRKGAYLDPKTHLNAVWAELLNSQGTEPRMLPGMVGEARLVLGGRAAVTAVPKTALLREGAEQFVLVEEVQRKEGGQYQRKSVVPGRGSEDWVEVRSGDVFPGDRVVTVGSHELAGYFAQEDLRLSPEATRSLQVEIEPITTHLVEDLVEVDGRVEVPADRRASAASAFAGTLVQVQVDRSQEVKKGEVVAGVFSLELQTLQLELLKAHLEGQLLDDTMARLRTIESAVPQRRLLELQSQVRAGKLLRDSLHRKLLLAGLSEQQILSLLTHQHLLDAVPVRAPIAGVVVALDRVIGQGVKAGEPILTIHDLSSPYIMGYVSERDVGLVRVGQEVRVRLLASPGFRGTGKVARTGRVLEGDQRILSVWVELATRPTQPLLHGQLAGLTLIRGTGFPARPT